MTTRQKLDRIETLLEELGDDEAIKRLEGSNGYASIIIAEIEAEISRAIAKFPTWPTDPLHAFAVVSEEFGETQKEVLQLTYEPHKSSKEAVRKEAVQLAAMSIRFLVSMDRYKYTPLAQHSQQLH